MESISKIIRTLEGTLNLAAHRSALESPSGTQSTHRSPEGSVRMRLSSSTEFSVSTHSGSIGPSKTTQLCTWVLAPSLRHKALTTPSFQSPEVTYQSLAKTQKLKHYQFALPRGRTGAPPTQRKDRPSQSCAVLLREPWPSPTGPGMSCQVRRACTLRALPTISRARVLPQPLPPSTQMPCRTVLRR